MGHTQCDKISDLTVGQVKLGGHAASSVRRGGWIAEGIRKANRGKHLLALHVDSTGVVLSFRGGREGALVESSDSQLIHRVIPLSPSMIAFFLADKK